MTDPKYLSDEGSEASDFERELLRAAQGVRLTATEKQAIWAGVALQATPLLVTTPSVAPAAAVKTALGLTPLVKGALFVLALGGLSMAGFWLNRGSVSVSSAPSASPSAHAALPQLAASEPDAAAAPSPVASAVESAAPPSASAATNAPVVNREASAKEKKSALSDESAAVLEIRRTLRGGDASSALRLLGQARQRFPKGALVQEREALTIEALAKSGARAAAARKAQAFLRAYPKSPYASDVQSFAAQ